MIGAILRMLHVRRRKARVRAIAREIELRLTIRREQRAKRQAAASRGWETRRAGGQ